MPAHQTLHLDSVHPSSRPLQFSKIYIKWISILNTIWVHWSIHCQCVLSLANRDAGNFVGIYTIGKKECLPFGIASQDIVTVAITSMRVAKHTKLAFLLLIIMTRCRASYILISSLFSVWSDCQMFWWGARFASIYIGATTLIDPVFYVGN